MKLAFCLFKYHPFGGLERDCLRYAQLYAERGHEVTIYASQWEGEDKIPPELRVKIIPVSGWSNHKRCTTFAEHLKPHIAKENYNAVIGFNRMPFLDIYYAADLCYAATIQQKHGFWSWYRLTPRYRRYAALERSVFSPASKTQILLLAESEQSNYIQAYGTPSERFHLIPPGIQKDERTPAERIAIRAKTRQKLGISHDEHLVLMVGSGFQTKGVDRALAAIAALPNQLRGHTQLFIIGRGKKKPFLRLAKQWNISDRVHFLGERRDVPDFMLAADVLLHPSYFETTGTVLLEAIVAGLPVLVTANCGYADHVKRAEAGYIVPVPFQQKTLNESLQKMLLSPLRNQWQRNALSYASSANIYHAPRCVIELIEQIAKK